MLEIVPPDRFVSDVCDASQTVDIFNLNQTSSATDPSKRAAKEIKLKT